MKYLACLLIAGSAVFADAKCRIMGKVSVLSQSRAFRLDLDNDGSFKIVSAASGSIVSKGKLELMGHHYTAWLSDRGDRIALVDSYAGYAVYDSRGKSLVFAPASEFLTTREAEGNKHKWTCHPEGEWLDSYKFGEQELVVSVYNKRQIRVPLRGKSL